MDVRIAACRGRERVMEVNIYEMMEAEQRRELRKALGEITGLSMLECAKAIKTLRLQLSSHDVEVNVRNEVRRRVEAGAKQFDDS